MSDIRVRFAPSPTGFLHIGSARTALFNWLFARANKGVFILRIEDTDKERSDKKYLDEILTSLEWLGLNWDEDLYFQSRRFDTYREIAERLVKEQKAYYEETEKGKAIRLKIHKDEVINFYDVIRDKIEINSSTLDDLVLIKSDGSPTYNFACVVDDADMKISHIIRGEDHIANTPKQLLVYRALDIKPPKFAHIPLILGEDKSRMSKRHGATSIAEYREKGYLPEAVINFLALMGWSPKNNQEKLKPEKIINMFSLKAVAKTGAVFNIKKLDWLNSEYIKEKNISEITDLVAAYLIRRKVIDEDYDRKWLEKVITSYRTRFCNIDEFILRTGFLFKDDFDYDPEAVDKHLREEKVLSNLLRLKDKLGPLKSFDPPAIETQMRSVAEELGISAGELVHPTRVAVTGTSVAPGIFEVMSLIGKERVLKRLGSVKEIIAAS